MPLDPRILSAAALRHVLEGSAVPPGRLTASELPPMAASWATTERLPVGGWKASRPRYVRRLAPCLIECPVGNDVEGFLGLLRQGDSEGAARRLASETPLAAVCGRVCYRPCEAACNRGGIDGAVDVRSVERYLGDLPIARSCDIWGEVGPASRKTVAVVGSGPAGLACAWALALLGHGVRVLERRPQPGGLLRYGIPAYRLPNRVLDREIRRLNALGIAFDCGQEVGRERDVAALRDRFDAVFVAAGAARSRTLGLDANGCAMPALEFLASVAQGEAPRVGGSCVVVGGGNSAIDAARCARRLGARATIVYRRTRAEMPAYAEEIEAAHREGVALLELALPVRLVRRDDTGSEARLAGVECVRTQLGDADATGRGAPVPVLGSEFVLPADSIIDALGEETAPDALARDPVLREALTRIDPWGAAARNGIFAGGDFAGTRRTVAHAIGSGKRAALAIDRSLRALEWSSLETFRIGRGPVSLEAYRSGARGDERAAGLDRVCLEELQLAYFDRRRRTAPLQREVRDPTGDFREIESGLSEARAHAAASRCFSCGRCTGCGNCQVFCPEGAVLRTVDSGHLAIHDAHCKGCGICVRECPRSAMVLEPIE